MINITHKLYPTIKQKQFLDNCLWSAIGIENWAINQIKYNLDDNWFPLKYQKPLQLRTILSKQIEGHSKKCNLPSKLINDCIGAVIDSYKRHGINKIHYKSSRKKKSFYFTGDIKISKNRLKIPGLKTTLRISQAGVFTGKLKKCTLIKKYNGWYVSCCYDQNRPPIVIKDGKEAGIDPGLSTSLVFSDGNTINFPKFYQQNQELLSKLQRKSKNSKKIKALHNKIKNQRKDHHHKLSTDIAKSYVKIYWSNDNFNGLKKLFGKQYSNLALGSFRDLLTNKLASRTDGFGELIKVSARNSTKTCSSCGALSGPTGLSGLEVRQWQCISCGTVHDRDVNAAINTLLSGKGITTNKRNLISRLESSMIADERSESKSNQAH